MPKPTFGLCCQEGRIYIPLLKETLAFLGDLLNHGGGKRASKFQKNIRVYKLIFAFTFVEAKIDNEINTKL